MTNSSKTTIFIVAALFAFGCHLIPVLTSQASIISLMMGIMLANIAHSPINLGNVRKLALNTAIILFGFGLDINNVIKVGSLGIAITFTSLIVVISSGYFLIKLFKMEAITGQLITFGTSICGGSAIAATSSVLKANSQQISVAMTSIFVLNSVALLVFPILGHWLHLSDEAFATFCALAIHDVSSVVGAASQFSPKALEIATILKLTRILWIIPIILILSKLNNSESKTRFPLFILLFIAASLITTFFPLPFTPVLTHLGKMLLALALFFIGYSVNIKAMKNMGLKGISFALSLWLISILSAYILIKILY